MNAYITSLATAAPDRRLSQQYAYDFLTSHFALEPAERDLYRRILLDGPIKTRCFAVDFDEQLCSADPDEQIARFGEQAGKLAVTAARRAMESASLKAADVGGLVVNTCTGYLCPGLSSYTAEALGLSRSVRVFDLMGMGCGAAIPNLQCAAGLLAQLDGKCVISIAVEVCSATLFMGASPDLVVSNSIFGDGAAACVLSASPNASPSIRLLDFETTLLPKYREHLRYHTRGGRLRNTLSRRVPAIGALAISQTVRRLLRRRKLRKEQVDFWAVHPGGSAVLDAVRHRIGLPEEALTHSRTILRDYGNMSSPSVLFVLNEHLSHSALLPGQTGLLLSFGAGFTAFAALVEVT